MFGPGRDALHVGRCLEVLEPDDFTGQNRVIFEAVREAYVRGVDLTHPGSVRSLCPGDLDPLCLVDLMEAAGSNATALRHIEVLKRNRRLRDWSSLVSTQPQNDEDMERMMLEAFRITHGSEPNRMKPIGEVVDDYLFTLKHQPDLLAPIKTGMDPFDEMVGGLYPGRLYVVGANTSFGKTAFMTQIACGVGRGGGTGLILSLEMGVMEMAERIVKLETEVSGGKLRSPRSMTEEDWNRIMEGKGEIHSADIRIAECFDNTSLDHIAARIRFAAALMDGLDIVVVDYVQLMSLGRRGETRNLELSEISRTLKLLAREMNAAVVMGSQLRRGSEGGKNEPTNDDLRDSGALGQDANMVILLDRPDERDKKKDKNEIQLGNSITTDIIIAKNRNGRTGRIEARFVPSQGRFEE